MNAEQITLVQKTFEKIEPIAETAAEMFYNRLFEIAPDVKPLFKGDMKKQGQMLMQMIGLAVRGLDKPASIVPTLRELGKRHVGYCGKIEYYDTVGAALLWTLGQGLGEEFTAEVKEAWTEAYTLLASVMKEGAAEGD